MKHLLPLLTLALFVPSGHAQFRGNTNNSPFVEEKPSKTPQGNNTQLEHELPRWIGTLVEWIEMDSETANKLIRSHITTGDATAMRTEIDALMDADEATLLSTQYVTSMSGRLAKSRSNNEFTYPAEYEPPGSIVHPDPKTVLRNFSAACPNNFNTRPLGFTLEVEAVLGADVQIINLNIHTDWTVFTGRDYQIREGSTNEELADMWHPKFFTLQAETATVLQDNRPILLQSENSLSPGKTVMVFLQANILR